MTAIAHEDRRPPSEFPVDDALASGLLRSQHPDIADRPLRRIAEGWDNVIFRLGEDLAVRLPRREAGARLISHEQTWLAHLAPRLPLPIPAPVRMGAPEGPYPWSWSVTPWFGGLTADLSPPNDDQGPTLAAFFAALHRPAPASAPLNPWRGTPLRARAATFEARRARLLQRGERFAPKLQTLWEAALRAADDALPTWIHGDMHPRNILVSEGRISAVIDWGDVAQGDRASDLAGVWMILRQPQARAAVLAAMPEVSLDTWARARGWALLFGVMLLGAGLADDPAMEPIARRIFANLLDGP